MARGWLRVVMVLVGLFVFAVYALAAVGGYLLLTWLFASRPSLPVTLAILGGFTLLAAYLSYRVGTARLLAGLDVAELPRSRAPELYRRLDQLCLEMDVTPPPVLVADLGAPNALSLGGPRTGVVVLDRRLLSLLTIDELEGIVAHELAHMERYDTFVQTFAVSLVRTLVGLVTLVLFPLILLLDGVDRGMAWMRGRPARRNVGLAAWVRRGIGALVDALLGVITLLMLAHSRRREYAADERAAEVTGNPVALARALSKIHRATSPERGLRSILYIHGDQSEEESPRRYLSTHPPVDERIDRLVEMASPSVGRHYIGRLRP